LDTHAATLALTPAFETLQLHVSALTVAGDTIHDTNVLSGVRYVALDPTLIAVNSSGLVHALSPTDETTIIASLTVRGVTLSDTVRVRVTTTLSAPRIATFSLQPSTSDSAHVNAAFNGEGGVKPTRITATDSDGMLIPPESLFVAFQSSDPVIASIDPATGLVTGLIPGHVTLYATGVQYGAVWRDSLPFDVGQSIAARVQVYSRTSIKSLTPELAFGPALVTIGVGGYVTWVNASTVDSVDIKFDDPASAQPACDFALGCFFVPESGTGDLPPFKAETTWAFAGWKSRTFPVAGTYHYHSEIYGTTGTIVVR